jgi:hypothetical protein
MPRRAPHFSPARLSSQRLQSSIHHIRAHVVRFGSNGLNRLSYRTLCNYVNYALREDEGQDVNYSALIGRCIDEYTSVSLAHWLSYPSPEHLYLPCTGLRIVCSSRWAPPLSAPSEWTDSESLVTNVYVTPDDDQL